ncbi:XdhC family protein [Aromatoleum toluolicum]|uniref:Xanthine dehydrogenase accessory factor n=1 Tax=Aromatoleum toluolicum TaxID=90060 RepID=A0ABX1NM47_9RHOO|nr:XdhC family protein [Aromatoleum toluolicum]NMG00405.1 XdhC family protein [Aromatoleum toluolicum]
MDSVNLEVLRQAVAWNAAGVPVTLATVVRTWGSSPRPEGALLAIAGDGRLVGSVSGGCIEDDLLDRLRSERPTQPEHVTYGITADQTRRFGLPCGGKLELVLEPVAPGNRLADTLAAIERGEMVARRLDLAHGTVDLLGDVPDSAVVFDGRTLVSAFGPRWRMLIIGAGQLSRYVAEFALALDYQVTICEPREEYRDCWSVLGATLTTEMPDDAVTALRPDRRTVIIGGTHDPKLDDLALIDALGTNAFYVGAIGSRANSERRRERLKLFDLTDADVDRLHGPVGLPLGSRTPPEIALAILADITARRNGVTLVATTTHPAAVGDACPSLT